MSPTALCCLKRGRGGGNKWELTSNISVCFPITTSNKNLEKTSQGIGADIWDGGWERNQVLVILLQKWWV